MIPTLQSDMYVDAFNGDQESTLQTSAARFVDDNISGPSVFRSLQLLGTYATATQSKRVEDNLSWVLDSMANVNDLLFIFVPPTLQGYVGSVELPSWRKKVPIHFGVTFSSIKSTVQYP